MPGRLATLGHETVALDWASKAASKAHAFPRFAVVLFVLVALVVVLVVAARAVVRRSATFVTDSGPRHAGTHADTHAGTEVVSASGVPTSDIPSLDTPPSDVLNDTAKTPTNTTRVAEAAGESEIRVETRTVGSLPVRQPGLQLLGPYGFGRDHLGRARTRPDPLFGTPGRTHLTPHKLPSGTPTTNRANNAGRLADAPATTPRATAEPGVVPSDGPGGIRSSN